jgi:hypothetical protein
MNPLLLGGLGWAISIMTTISIVLVYRRAATVYWHTRARAAELELRRLRRQLSRPTPQDAAPTVVFHKIVIPQPDQPTAILPQIEV